jgi:hypothetical protein
VSSLTNIQDCASIPDFYLYYQLHHIYLYIYTIYTCITSYIILSVAWFAIGYVSSIFSVSGILFVVCRVYSQCLASYWLHVENILSVSHPIGGVSRIFSVSGILLVVCRVCTQYIASYWLCVECVISVWHPIGCVSSIFSVPSIRLVRFRR